MFGEEYSMMSFFPLPNWFVPYRFCARFSSSEGPFGEEVDAEGVEEESLAVDGREESSVTWVRTVRMRVSVLR